MKVLVTGANGLIGRALCSMLDRGEYQVVRAVRTSTKPEEISTGELNDLTEWGEVLGLGIDLVVHLAGQTPDGGKETNLTGKLFDQANARGAAHFASKCAQYGVKRFVFVSTVKVLGDGKAGPYRHGDAAAPVDAYALSKWNAEQALCQISQEAGLEVVILRPPLVYGPGVKGNFLRLLQAVDQWQPLPFGSIQNHRSLVYLGNLVDLIKLCLVHPAAAGKTFLVSDGDDVSTPELIRRVAKALGRKPLLVPVPVRWLKSAGSLLGKQDTVDRLLGSFSVDIAPVRQTLGWDPPYGMQTGLAATAQWYRQTRARGCPGARS